MDKRLKIAEPAPPEGQSFADIYRCHQKELLAFVKSKVGAGPPDPEDVVQQSFANMAAFDTLPNIRNPMAFLVRTAKNLIIDHRRMAHSKTVIVELDDLENPDIIRDEISPETVHLGKQRLGQVVAVIAKLPERQRRFLLLNRVEGKSYTDISRQSGTSISTVRREVEAGVRACRRALEAEKIPESAV